MKENKGMYRQGNLTTGIFLIGLALALAFHHYFLPIFFVTLALTASIHNWRRNKRDEAIYSLIWMGTLALCFATNKFFLMLVGICASAIYASLGRQVWQTRRTIPVTPPPAVVQNETAEPKTIQEQAFRPYEQGYPPASSPTPGYGEEQAPLPYAEEDELPQARYPEQQQQS